MALILCRGELCSPVASVTTTGEHSSPLLGCRNAVVHSQEGFPLDNVSCLRYNVNKIAYTHL